MGGLDPADSTEVTLGEVSRGLSRVEREMHGIRDEISRLSFVPAAVYSADTHAYRDRMARLESAVRQEGELRLAAETAASQRAWQARLGIILALVGLPLSIIGSVLAGLVIASVK